MKCLLCWVIILLPVLAARGQEAVRPVAETNGSFQATNTAEDIVYVTATGSKYHKAGCRYLAKSRRAMPLSEAAARYTPCSVCFGSADAAPRKDGTSYGSGAPSGETTPTGKEIYVGPRGGRYHYSKSGKKVYEKKK